MINDVIGFTVGTADDAIVTGTDDVVGHGFENARPAFISSIGVRAHDVVGDAVIDAVAIILPAPAAVETIIASVVFADAWAFESVPVPVAAIHEPVRFEALPIRTGAQNGSALVLQFSHTFHRGHHQSGARANIVGGIEKIASVEEIWEVDPWPFNVQSLATISEGKVIRRRFNDQNTMRAAIRDADRISLRFRFQPPAGVM